MVQGLAKTGTYLAVFITALTSVLWVVLLMQPKGWALRISKYYTVETGAWQVVISRGALLKIVPGMNGRRVNQFLNLMSPAVRSTEDFKEFLCGISHMTLFVSDVCLIGSNLYIASIILISCVFFGTFLNWCACGFLAMWAFMKPRESSRLWARILYFLGFACYGAGLGQYAGAANGLAKLPPAGEQIAFGRNVFGGLVLCILQCIPIFTVFVFVGRTRDEAVNEHKSHTKKAAREESRLANQQYFEEVGYGAAGSGYDPSYDAGWSVTSFEQQAAQAPVPAVTAAEVPAGVAMGPVPMGLPVPQQVTAPNP